MPHLTDRDSPSNKEGEMTSAIAIILATTIIAPAMPDVLRINSVVVVEGIVT